LRTEPYRIDAISKYHKQAREAIDALKVRMRSNGLIGQFTIVDPLFSKSLNIKVHYISPNIAKTSLRGASIIKPVLPR